MRVSRKGVVISILVIGLGTAWLLNVLEIHPSIDWMWTIGLGLAGILTLAFGGFNKLTAVAGPMLLAASVLSVLRQTGRMPAKLEVPVLTILLGVLLLVVNSLGLAMPGPKDREEGGPPEKPGRGGEPGGTGR